MEFKLICGPKFLYFIKIKQLRRSFPCALKPNNRLSEAGGEGSTSIINSRRPERQSVRPSVYLSRPIGTTSIFFFCFCRGYYFLGGRFAIEYARVDPCNLPHTPSVVFLTPFDNETIPRHLNLHVCASNNGPVFLSYTAALKYAEFLERNCISMQL